jgi:hypothetical protein
VVPGCTIAYGLQIHHWQRPVGKKGRAELVNLARVCKLHHYMLTNLGCRLAGASGQWRFIDPRHPDIPDTRSEAAKAAHAARDARWAQAQAAKKNAGPAGRAGPEGRAGPAGTPHRRRRNGPDDAAGPPVDTTGPPGGGRAARAPSGATATHD